MTGQAFTADEVAEFYDELEKVLAAWLGESIHYGYWPDGPDEDFTAAQDRLTHLVAAELAPAPGSAVLDVGCGTGRPAELIARARGCAITGISLSAQQIEVAAARDLPLLRFERADAVDLPFADESFDAALALESLLHMPDLPAALAEIHRVLRPGARFAVADFVERLPADRAPDGLPLTPPPPLDELVGLLRAAGFGVERVQDISDATRPTYDVMLAAIDARRATLDAIPNRRIADQVQHAIPALAAHAREHTGYAVLTTTRGDRVA
ncbi:SAM-dependent methyltransferase [Saccharopolyspora sp. CA-218241]|uniref:SAM-dependent methyltransferase n=1 Tax=Saccharopolyspora sp. CA-218241 TaxID=3240027 RepID=UPI003D975067